MIIGVVVEKKFHSISEAITKPRQETVNKIFEPSLTCIINPEFNQYM